MTILQNLNNNIKYSCIVADCPWRPTLHANNPRRATLDKAGPQKHYPTMTVEEIERIEVPSADNAHLYLWVINQHVDWGYRVARAWGFEPIQMITWVKPGLGAGRFQCNTEHFLVCRKGKLSFAQGIAKYASASPGTWFNWERGRHSEKPDAMFDLVERLSPGPRLELFARKERLNWDSWGLDLND